MMNGYINFLALACANLFADILALVDITAWVSLALYFHVLGDFI